MRAQLFDISLRVFATHDTFSFFVAFLATCCSLIVRWPYYHRFFEQQAPSDFYPAPQCRVSSPPLALRIQIRCRQSCRMGRALRETHHHSELQIEEYRFRRSPSAFRLRSVSYGGQVAPPMLRRQSRRENGQHPGGTSSRFQVLLANVKSRNQVGSAVSRAPSVSTCSRRRITGQRYS